MAGDHSLKRKAPMSASEVEAERAGKDRLKSILLLVRDHMKAKEEAHEVELKLERIHGELSMLEEMMDMMEAKRQRLEEEKEMVKKELSGINIPPLDWDKMNCGFMNRYQEMEARKVIICGLPARGIMPQLHTHPPQEADDDQGSDVVELTRAEYHSAMGYDDDGYTELTLPEYHRAMEYLVRVEKDEEDIEPEFRILLKKLRKEEQIRNSAAELRPNQEQGESSRKRSRR